ncbi:MAG: hypothetical protein VW547_13125 [Alphaproteobacteria bacterium]
MGYKGGSALDIAFERGECIGRAGPLLGSTLRKADWIKSGKIRIFA